MTYRGTLQNGVVVPTGPLPPWPEGTTVDLVPLVAPDRTAANAGPSAQSGDETAQGGTAGRSKLLDLIKEIESRPCDLPEDLAINHDHYLYGTPKRK